MVTVTHTYIQLIQIKSATNSYIFKFISLVSLFRKHKRNPIWVQSFTTASDICIRFYFDGFKYKSKGEIRIYENIHECNEWQSLQS